MLFKLLSIYVIIGTYSVMAYKVEQIPGPILVLGEGPHWDVQTQSLYYIDIYDNGSIYRYDYNENKVYHAKIENENVVSFITPVEGTADKFAVGIGRRIGIIQWDGKSSVAKVDRIALEVEKDPKLEHNRFNDAKADPKGRFFGGTMRIEEKGDIFEARHGSLYRYTKGEMQPKLLKDNISVSNGMAWNETTNKFYYIDSCDLEVKEYDYDPNTGDISKPRVLIDFRLANGERPEFVPDGMTIDSQGYLYVATFGGSKIIKVNPKTGNAELEIQMPCEQITSVAFGGPQLDILYVTTASIGNKPQPAGATFKITGLNAIGKEMYKIKV